MSDSEHSDGLEDLQDLLEEYKAKDSKENDEEKETKHNTVKIENTQVREMEKIIFGDKAGLLRNMAKAVGEEQSDEEGETDATNKIVRKAEKRKPAWTDKDDEDMVIGEVKVEPRITGPRNHIKKDKTYKNFLTQRFENIVGAHPKWAKLERDDEQDVNSDDEELLRTVGFLEKPSSTILKPNHLSYKHCRTLNNATDLCEGPIVSIQFHPTSTAALIAGEYGYATIYALDGRRNEKLHSIHFKNFPLKCVKMSPCGTKAFFAANKRFYYVYDLLTAQETRFFLPREIGTLEKFELSPCGRYMAVAGRCGELHLYDANSQELIYSFKQENEVAALQFTADSKRIICNSSSSNVSIFSINKRRIEHNFFDEGCIRGSALSLSPNQRMLALGSMEGVVNVYNFENVQTTSTPVPIKRFLNLTTAISDVKFNHSSELLAMSSGEVNDALKLAHFPSGTVYANFPEMKPYLGPIRTVEFSPNSGYLAMGSSNKLVTPYRLKHFNNY